MPYYCTVPRCTSMAGKVKNVSFHQFPRDEELAEQWNTVLKRGKPYTKYSKVCSLHFRPEDYTMTSVGKNKGQWRTLRKDAMPSRNLPFEVPNGSTAQPTRRVSAPLSTPYAEMPNLANPQVQHQMAQAIYMQTMLAIQAANRSDSSSASTSNEDVTDTGLEIGKLASNADRMSPFLDSLPRASSCKITDLNEPPLEQNGTNDDCVNSKTEDTSDSGPVEDSIRADVQTAWYKCKQCTKCFKDPDVFTLHKRSHKDKGQLKVRSAESTLEANPMLANLLNKDTNLEGLNVVNSVLNLENQVMAAMAYNMQAYIRNLSSLIATNSKKNGDGDSVSSSDGKELDEPNDSSELIVNEST